MFFIRQSHLRTVSKRLIVSDSPTICRFSPLLQQQFQHKINGDMTLQLNLRQIFKKSYTDYTAILIVAWSFAAICAFMFVVLVRILVLARVLNFTFFVLTKQVLELMSFTHV